MSNDKLQQTFGTISPMLRDKVNVSDALIDKLYTASTESAFRSSGAGSHYATWQTITSQFDRTGYFPMIPDYEKTGLFFFTRPKLNLMGSNLRQDRVMATLDTINPKSFPFSIRCYLDSNFANWDLMSNIVQKCPLVNPESPFIVPLTNQLMSMSGFPDFEVQRETLAKGFYGEDQTIARGSDMNNGTYDFTMTFGNFNGGYIDAFFLYWIRYIALVARGDMFAYQEDIYARRLCYTCSIYRFVLDSSKTFITRWCKATGCFPYNIPIGRIFDVTAKEAYITAAQEITIPFIANHVEYNDPIIFKDFNSRVDWWAGSQYPFRSASDGTLISNMGRVKSTLRTGADNFRGIPYIDTWSGSNELMFLADPQELVDPDDSVITQISSSIEEQLKALDAQVNANQKSS